jgi:hypothetical protein
LERGGIILGSKTNDMPDAGDHVIGGIAREGGVFDFLLWRWSGCVKLGTLR